VTVGKDTGESKVEVSLSEDKRETGKRGVLRQRMRGGKVTRMEGDWVKGENKME
jgi:hypothetical protein